ncbi:MAG: cytochrome-c peroxidase [Thermoanaerobaculia bacterium]
MSRAPALAVAVLLLAACSKPAEEPKVGRAERKTLAEQAKSTLGVLPEQMPGAESDTPAQVALGRSLWFERRLSVNATQSCNDCHRLDGESPTGADGERTSGGARGTKGERNSPSVKNAGYHVAQFWDGRARTLEEQAEAPILNPVEMAMPDAAAVEAALRGAPEYRDPFAAAFPGEADPLTLRNTARALAAFERTLKTRDRLDDFLRGDLDALSHRETAGLKLFLATGCTTCHNSPTIGANQYQVLGLVKEWETKDEGRFAVTKNEEDRKKFKVPSLRNAVTTGPWFHDGSVDRLDEAVRKMAWHQLGKELTDDEISSIVAFLGALADRSGPVDPPAPSP